MVVEILRVVFACVGVVAAAACVIAWAHVVLDKKRRDLLREVERDFRERKEKDRKAEKAKMWTDFAIREAHHALDDALGAEAPPDERGPHDLARRIRALKGPAPSEEESVARLWEFIERRTTPGRGMDLGPPPGADKLTPLGAGHPAASLQPGDACVVRLRGGRSMEARVEEVVEGLTERTLYFTVVTDYQGEPAYYYHYVDHALVDPAHVKGTQEAPE